MLKNGEKRPLLNSDGPSSDAPEKESSRPEQKKRAIQSSTLSGSTTSEKLNEQAQLLVDEINVKRKNDNTMLADFRKELETQSEQWSSSLDETMIQMYEKNSKVIQEKLQDLYATLDRISDLERELMTFKDSLSILYNEIKVEE